MKRTKHAMGAIALGLATAWVPVLRSVGDSQIDSPTCELIAPYTYQIDFRASLDAGPIEVFASSRPDRIDSPTPVQTIRATPANISLPNRSGRVYFHLKSASGATRVVSIRRLPLEGAKNFRDLGGYRTSDGHYVRWGWCTDPAIWSI